MEMDGRMTGVDIRGVVGSVGCFPPVSDPTIPHPGL